MTYSQAKIDAYKKLDEAIEALRVAYGYTDDKEVLTGYVLLTSGIEFMDADPDDPTADDLDTRGFNSIYARRGQDPTLTFGILQEAVRKYNDVQVNYDGDD